MNETTWIQIHIDKTTFIMIYDNKSDTNMKLILYYHDYFCTQVMSFILVD